MKSISADEVLCFHCGRKHDVVSAHGVAMVDCPARYAHDIILLKTECPAYLPIEVTDSNCTGNCRQCVLGDEWREWA